MVVSDSITSTLDEFRDLVKKMIDYLNEDANKHPEEYRSRVGSGIEDLVLETIIVCAKDAPFEKTSFRKTSKCLEFVFLGKNS